VSGSRLATGGLIDREQVLSFVFNGKRYSGFHGDSVASALLANGVQLTARSFKYHRPRGIVSSGIEESGTFVELAGDDESGNVPVTRVRLTEGLNVKSVNCWPGPVWDLMSVNQLFSRLLPAAFYYKTFKWPDWHWYEPLIRRAAGLAPAPAKVYAEDVYETRYGHCDVLIVGSGPAGLVAARTLAESGSRVILVDNGVQPGGSLLEHSEMVDGQTPADWLTNQLQALQNLPNVKHLQQATAWAYREQNLVMVEEKFPDKTDLRARGWRIRAKRVLLATGAIERSLVFCGNDLPGVMLCSAVSAYINRYSVLPGDKVIVFTNNSSVLQTIRDLQRAGAEVQAIVDSRTSVEQSEYREFDGVPLYLNHQLTSSTGKRRVDGATVRDQLTGREFTIKCGLIAISGGWNPNVQLHSQSRGTLRYEDSIAAFVPATSEQAVTCVGAANGCFDIDQTIADTATVAKQLQTLLDPEPGINDPLIELSAEFKPVANGYSIEPLWHIADPKHPDKAFVDIQNDVTLADVHLSIREGFSAVEHVKRYTTAGMGMDQGRTGNINVIGAIANHTGQTLPDIGTTTFRSPVTPVEFGSIAGQREDSVVLPYRHTPLTQWHKDYGACMYESGARWQRPGYYPRNGETFQETVNRESLTVRQGVGVYDGSPLGKFEIKGKDALEFINLMYTNAFDTLANGQGQYGIMLSDDGLILDDGVCFKLDANHYLLSTSTGHADAVYRHMLLLQQVERPEWDVLITPVTSQWCNATVCGPAARELLEKLESDIDYSIKAFPFMSLRDGSVAGCNARVCRVSFTGELSFEINVSPGDLSHLWHRIMEAGADLGIAPIGSEANHVLRVEKGFLSLGHEADGTTDPLDLGFNWIMSKTKRDYIGKRSVALRRAAGAQRRELVGLLPEDPAQLIPEGAPLTPDGKRLPSEGLVTASVWSVVNNRSIGLALLQNGRARMGETVSARLKDSVIRAVVTRPCFHDPEGIRLKHQ